jgi:hypothetical protein
VNAVSTWNIAEDQEATSHQRRTVCVFLSCPGDVSKEKDLLDNTIRDIGSVFRRFGIDVIAWRHERDVVPEFGADPQEVVNRSLPENYDIYVGLMCGRFGTPTRRAPSGTIEEFYDACERHVQTGRPRILFYFCSRPKGATFNQNSQLEKVRAFQQEYPGIFSSFRSGSDLAVKFQRHLVDCIFGLISPNPGGSSTPRSRKWIPVIAPEIDRLEAAIASRYLDISSRKPERILKKLETLFDVESILTPLERELLTAALYSRTLRSVERLAAQPQRQLGAFYTQFSFEEMSQLQTLTDGQVTLPSTSTLVRSDLLMTLLQLGDILDTDWKSISGKRTARFPDSRKLTHWLSFLTHEVSVEQRGVIKFRLLAPAGEWAIALRRLSALRVENLWTKRRTLFVKYGVVFAVAPGEVLITDAVERVPDEVLSRLDTVGAWLLAHQPSIQHWGVPANENLSPDLDMLIPLPHSAVLENVYFKSSGTEFARRLILKPRNGPEVILDAPQDAPLTLNPRLLKPKVLYCWVLYRDYGTGELSDTHWGELYFLGERERILWSVQSEDCGSAERRALQIELQLWNDVLRDLWPHLHEPDAQYEHWMLARRILFSAYEDVRRIAPGSTQVDLYRKVTEWVDSEIQKYTRAEVTS